MTSPRFGSVLIGSAKADDLRSWYEKTFEPERDGDGGLRFGDGRFLIFPHDGVGERAAEPARIIVNLYVDDAKAYEETLLAKGVTFIRPVEEESFGWIGTIEDPDGNYVQIAQLKH